MVEAEVARGQSMSRKPYLRPLPKATWYLRNSRYRRYMLREVTCLLVGFYCFLAIWALAVLAGGSAEGWEAFLRGQQNALMVFVHALALIYFLVYMTFDWFKLAPKAMPIQFGDRMVPDRVIVVAHYAAWVVVSLLVLGLAGVF
jgi:fumarate reductase subunit C